MEALILLLIAVIAAPILLVLVRSSAKGAAPPPEKEEGGIRITASRSGAPRPVCPRCGSPVMLRRGGWECGWCLDSGELALLSRTQPRAELRARILCGVDLPGTWAELKTELGRLVPQHADALLPALGHMAAHQLSRSAPTEDAQREAASLRDLRAFVETEKELGLPGGAAARIAHGETLYADEGALSEEAFGSFWQALLDALEEEGALPWDTDTDRFFGAAADLRFWRSGGPGADPAYNAGRDALQMAFHARWEALHPEEA